jgi:hypothetical protein
MRDTFIVSPMVDIGRNTFILYLRARDRSKATNSSNLTLHLIIKACLAPLGNQIYPWTNPGYMIFRKCPKNKMLF